MDAAKSEALSRPNANRPAAHFPANGTRALAASPASLMVVRPLALSVAAQQIMMKNTMAMQEMLPTSTSHRACLYWRGPTFFST